MTPYQAISAVLADGRARSVRAITDLLVMRGYRWPLRVGTTTTPRPTVERVYRTLIAMQRDQKVRRLSGTPTLWRLPDQGEHR